MTGFVALLKYTYDIFKDKENIEKLKSVTKPRSKLLIEA